MAIAFVKSTGKARATSNPDTASASFGSLPAAGNFIGVQALAYENSTDLDLAAGGVTDNQGNTYALAVRAPISRILTQTEYITTATYYDESIGSPSGTYTITVNPAGTGSFGAIVLVGTEWSGMATSGSLDATANIDGASNTPTPGTTATTAQADELVLANLVTAEQGGDNIFTSITVQSVSPAWTERAEELDGDTYQSGEFDSRIVTSTGTQTCAWTTVNTGTAEFAACIATFKASSGGGPADRGAPDWIGIQRQAINGALR